MNVSVLACAVHSVILGWDFPTGTNELIRNVKVCVCRDKGEWWTCSPLCSNSVHSDTAVSGPFSVKGALWVSAVVSWRHLMMWSRWKVPAIWETVPIARGWLTNTPAPLRHNFKEDKFVPILTNLQYWIMSQIMTIIRSNDDLHCFVLFSPL